MKCLIGGLIAGLIVGFLYVSTHQTIGEEKWTLKKSFALQFQARASF